MRLSEAEYATIKARQAKLMPVRSVDLVLPFPPSVNNTGADSFRGGRKSAAYKAFIEAVARCVTDHGSPRLEGRLRVRIGLIKPSRLHRFDIDNRLKGMLDALQKAHVFADDEQIDDLRVYRMPSTTSAGGALVSVEGA